MPDASGKCRCDGAAYHTDAYNRARIPFLVHPDCPVHPSGGVVAPEEAIPDDAIDAAEKMDIEAIATRYDAAFRDRDRQTAAAWESARDVPGLVGRVAELAAQRQALLDECDQAERRSGWLWVNDIRARLGVTEEERTDA